MNRNTILNKIVEEIQDNIDIAEVKRGAQAVGDIVNRPFIGVTMGPEIIDKEDFESFAAKQRMLMKIYLYCYMDTDDTGNYDKMHILMKDLEFFFKYTFSYKDYVVMNKIDPYEAGVSAPAKMFIVDLEAKYENEI